MDKVIVCDKCGHHGCNVTEERKPKEKVGMKEFAAMGKDPHAANEWTLDRDAYAARKYVISCPECGHKITYATRPNLYGVPYFKEIDPV